MCHIKPLQLSVLEADHSAIICMKVLCCAPLQQFVSMVLTTLQNSL